MQRIQGSTVETDKFGANKHGFSEGNAETQRPATIVTAAWLDGVQEELARAIEWSGQTPNAADYGQLVRALELAASRGPSAPPGTDPTVLLSRVNTWTAQQTFSQPVKLTAGHVANSLGVQGEVVYCGDDGAIQTRDRTILIPPTAFVPEVAISGSPLDGSLKIHPSWYFSPAPGTQGLGQGWTNVTAEKKLVGMFRLPHGARLKSVTAYYNLPSGMPAGASLYMDAGVWRADTANATLETLETTSRNTTGSHEVTIDVNKFYVSGSNPQVLWSDWHLGYVEFTTYNTSASIRWVKATFTDPGPRNF